MHALFDKTAAKNTWTIAANVLRDFVEYFGPKTEQLDIYSENGRATFTSYTERIMEGKGKVKLSRVLILPQSMTGDRNIETTSPDRCSD